MKKKRLAVAAILIFLGGCTSLTFYSFIRVEKGENVASVSWLPKEATNVSYYRSYIFTAYEFDISEKGFLQWCQWETKEISEPVAVLRYTSKSGKQTPIISTNTESLYESDGPFARVKNGLYYRYVNERNGGGVTVVFDRDRGRVFFHSNPR